MASFNMANAKIGRSKLPKLLAGKHLVVCDDIHECGERVKGFCLEFTVVKGPSGAGFRSDGAYFPNEARAAGRMTAEMAKERELGKIQVAIAAVAGLPRARANEIDDDRYTAAIERPVSPLRGRQFVVDAVPHVNQKGETTVYYDYLPFDGTETFSDTPAAPVASVPKTLNVPKPLAPKPPAPPAKPLTTDQLIAKHGFKVHPDNEEYVFNAEGRCIAITEFLTEFKS